MSRDLASWLCLVLLCWPAGAGAQMLDDLLPVTIPGFAPGAPALTPRQGRALGATGWRFGTLSLSPTLSATSGYDSAPNGAAGSMLVQLSPSLAVSDPVAGFGAYALVSPSLYPQDQPQSSTMAALAVGQGFTMARQTLTLAGGFVRGAETGFAIGAGSLARPLPFTLSQIRLNDAITQAALTITPELSASLLRFPDAPAQDRSDLRPALRLAYNDGAPVSYLLALRGDLSDGRIVAQDATNLALLGGVREQASGLWSVSVLAGGAGRLPRQGPALLTPALEIRLDWAPDRLDELRLNLVRELDDPDRVSALPYTLSAAKFTLLRAGLQQLSFKAQGEVSQADYLHGDLRETLVNLGATVAWQLSPFLALELRYGFNDRQSPQLGAANEHVMTMGVSWTP
ncbi:porin family protein [Acidocella facilis]|uniref:outer membrane beta-barrel protein n=1 Tax=Acidocella facilis TaxID=525 RepID=UPI00138E37CD|nr:outer membrane beta-barrel protein [Acidocella facilis]